MKKICLTGMLILCGVVVLNGCKDPEKNNENNASDYSDMNNWMSMPSDPTKDVDVFYLYPTTYMASESDPDFCDITHSAMREGAQGQMKSQATVFENICNIYAPYYRQSSISTMEDYSYNDLMNILETSENTTDVLAAFDYYVKNKNNGRPFILAGHSQGSMMLLFVLSKYMKEHPDVYDRMIAAYLIGYGVTNDYLQKNSHLAFAENATDTKVIISYNTEGETVEGVSPVAPTGSISINPLSWTRTVGAHANTSLNLGTCRLVDGQLRDSTGFADAKISSRGTVICSTVDPDDYKLSFDVFPRGVYHGADYRFYYYNLRKNAEDRVNAYLKK